MHTFKTVQLIEQLKAEANIVLNTAHQLSKLDNNTLNTPPEPGKWSLAQILEHLNTYNRYYLPLAASAIATAKKSAEYKTFKPGWLGNYFTKSMYSEVVSAKKVTNKMSAMKGHIPADTLDGAAVIKEFIESQTELLRLLDDAHNVNLAGIRIPITISKWIKISLGDAFRFLVAHQIRHHLQINNTLAVVKTK